MKNSIGKGWRTARSRFEFDPFSLLLVLTALIFGYILFHLVYPMISKGLIW